MSSATSIEKEEGMGIAVSLRQDDSKTVKAILLLSNIENYRYSFSLFDICLFLYFNHFKTVNFPSSNTAYKVCLPSRVIFQISVPSSIGTPRPLVIVNSGTPILPFIPAVKPYEMNGQGFLQPRPLDTKVFKGTFLCRLKFSRQQCFV